MAKQGKFSDSDRLKSMEKALDFEKNELGINPTYSIREGVRFDWKTKALSGQTAPNILLDY